ncbi:MAG: hypothetical protein Q4E54_02050 [Lachnospiraceae bacterium]|nr:hypothetical protein [Lachnospiraceae bacterium]
MKKFVSTIIIVTLIAMSAMTSFAFTFKEAAKLKNADKPFIDLSGLIGDAELGTGGNAEAALSGNTDTQTPDEGGTGLAGVVQDVLMETVTRVEMVIEVHDRTIKVNGITEKDADAAKAAISANYKKGMDVRLIDDYAEYRTYSDVLAILEELKIRPDEERRQ